MGGRQRRPRMTPLSVPSHFDISTCDQAVLARQDPRTSSGACRGESGMYVVPHTLPLLHMPLLDKQHTINKRVMSRKVLVFGGKGALGNAVLQQFAAKNWSAASIDLFEAEAKIAPLGNIIIKQSYSIEEMQNAILSGIAKNKFDAIVNVAGGWAGGDVADAEMAKNAELMIRQSIFSSVASAHVASVAGNERSLLLMTGSAAALNPTSFMVGYGLAKAGVHHLVRSAAADPSKLPAGACVLGICPYTLDTPGNRAGMPDADYSSWTSLEYASEQILKWAENPDARPKSGSLVVWKTEKGSTTNIIQ